MGFALTLYLHSILKVWGMPVHATLRHGPPHPIWGTVNFPSPVIPLLGKM